MRHGVQKQEQSLDFKTKKFFLAYFFSFSNKAGHLRKVKKNLKMSIFEVKSHKQRFYLSYVFFIKRSEDFHILRTQIIFILINNQTLGCFYKQMRRIIFTLVLLLLLNFALAYDSTVLSQCAGSCTSSCGICNGTSCTKCQEGYTLNTGNNTCALNPCSIADCSKCDSSGTVCLKCTDPYSIFMSGTPSCFQVCQLPNCAKCLAGSASCLVCNSGYTLYSLNNKCITTPTSNCLVAYDFKKQQYLCTLCSSGYKPTKDQTECIPDTCADISDCITCPSPTTCSQCRGGYSFTNGFCQRNLCDVTNCLYCDNNGVCLRCQSSYDLIANHCSAKSCSLPNCALCKTGSLYCEVCLEGYSYNIWTKACQMVTLNSQPINCQLVQTFPVTGLFSCVKCLPTFVFTNENQITCLQKCDANCQTCVNTTACGVCNPGYTLTNGSCVKIVCSNTTECSLCTANGTCLQCTDPYSLYNTDTRTCMQYCLLSNCHKCRRNSKTCEQCHAGYAVYSWNGACVSSIIPNCMVLHDWRFHEFQCTRCVSGYRPSSDQTECILSFCSTIRDCQVCKSPLICDRCRVGYVFDGNQCLRNICDVKNCLYCNEEGKCLRSTSNFSILAESRIEAVSCKLKDCSSCKQNSMFCDSCVSEKAYNIWTNACDQQGKVSGSNLKYLWLLSIGVVIIITAIILVWVYKKRKNEENNKVAAKTEDNMNVPNTNRAQEKETEENIIQKKCETEGDFKSPVRLPPLQRLEQVSSLMPNDDNLDNLFTTPKLQILLKKNDL